MTPELTSLEFSLGVGGGFFIVFVGMIMIQVRAYRLVKQIPDVIRNPYTGALDISTPGVFWPWSWPFNRQVNEANIPAYISIRRKQEFFRLAWFVAGVLTVIANVHFMPFGIPLFSVFAFVVLYLSLPVWWKAPPIPSQNAG